MTTPLRRRWTRILLVLVVLGCVGWWLLQPATDADTQAGAVVPQVGSEGTVFGPIASASPQAAASGPTAAQPVPPAAPDEDAMRLWPHLRQGGPTPEQRAAVQAQWSRFAQAHPDNLYLPAAMQASLTPEQARVARQRLDNTTAVVARQAAQSYAQKYVEPGQAPPPPPAAPTDVAMQRDFFDYKIRELESRLQLVNFYLAQGQPSADKRAAANKDIQQWTRELESLRQARAMLPSS